MLLAIDIGNTNTVFALYDGQDLKHVWRVQSSSGRSADEYAAFLYPLLLAANLKWSSISQIIAASVVPDANFYLSDFAGRYMDQDIHFVTLENSDVKFAALKPTGVGADRLVNALAVQQFYQTPAIIIDSGTATKFDVIDSNGAYHGGLIAPGLELSADALNKATAKLPRVAVKKPDQLIGSHTIEAIQSGLYWGYVAMVEGIVERLAKDMTQKPYVIATGGLASIFTDDVSCIDTVDQNLTLKGLAFIASRNG